MTSESHAQPSGSPQHHEAPPKPRSLLGLIYKFLVISALVHVVGLLIFGGYVVLKKLQPEEVTFVQPPTVKRVEPKKRQYKLRVKQQQQRSARPKVQPRMQSARMSDIALPTIKTKVAPIKHQKLTNLPGMGDALGEGLGFGGGTGALSEFGYTVGGRNLLSGSLFDLKLTPDKKPVSRKMESGRERQEYAGEVSQRFVRGSSLKTSSLERDFFRSEKQLHASFWVLPYSNASKAPQAFNVANEVDPMLLLVPYSGTFVPKVTGRFRFYGRADDILIVRLNGRIVLDGSWDKDRYSNWRPSGKDAGTEGEALFGNKMPGIYGNWMNLTAGKSYDLDVIVGEVPGGWFGFWLAIQESGGEPYIFSTKPLTNEERDHLRKLHKDSAKLMPPK